jgi:hypothetical protein
VLSAVLSASLRRLAVMYRCVRTVLIKTAPILRRHGYERYATGAIVRGAHSARVQEPGKSSSARDRVGPLTSSLDRPAGLFYNRTSDTSGAQGTALLGVFLAIMACSSTP